MDCKQDPQASSPVTPEMHLAAAGAGLDEAAELGPHHPDYLAVVLTSIAHSMHVLASDAVSRSWYAADCPPPGH